MADAPSASPLADFIRTRVSPIGATTAPIGETTEPDSSTLDVLRRALESAGVEFTKGDASAVRLKPR
jgi:hypothetical protein